MKQYLMKIIKTWKSNIKTQSRLVHDPSTEKCEIEYSTRFTGLPAYLIIFGIFLVAATLSSCVGLILR